MQGSRSVPMFLLTSETINSHAIDTSEAWKYSHKKSYVIHTNSGLTYHNPENRSPCFHEYHGSSYKDLHVSRCQVLEISLKNRSLRMNRATKEISTDADRQVK